MRTLTRWLRMEIGNRKTDAWIGEGSAHLAALVVFVTGMGGVSARATTPFEVMTGTLVVLGVCVVLVVLGRITGLAAQLPLLKNNHR
jgi:hypothetical protein